MNNNNIQISPILGSDSLSSSRIVINDNFKILANALENYQEYFNENGLYSSVIISKNEIGTIDFKTDENHTIMELSSNGIEINGKLIVNGRDPATFETIKARKIVPNNNNVIIFEGDVEIQGNLAVSGDTPGSGEESILYQSITDFERAVTNAGSNETVYELAFKKGCYVVPSADKNVIKEQILEKLLTTPNPKKLLQYVNKPLIFCGKGLTVCIEHPTFLKTKVITNGKFVERDNKFYLIATTFPDYESATQSISAIKIYPIINDFINNCEILFNIEICGLAS